MSIDNLCSALAFLREGHEPQPVLLPRIASQSEQ